MIDERSEKKKFVIKAIVFTVIFILALEAIIRIDIPVIARDGFTIVNNGGMVYHSELKQPMYVNSDVRYKTAEYNVITHYNSLGFRDEEHQFEKPDGVYRIVVLGDSFTTGVQVEDQRTMISRLREMLGDRKIDGRTIEIINLAFPGFATDHEYLVLKSLGEKYDPDLVIVLFTDDDVIENYTQNIVRLNETGGIEQVCAEGEYTFKYRLKSYNKYLSSPYYIESIINSMKENPPESKDNIRKYLYSYNTTPEINASWNITKKLMSCMGERAEENSYDLIIVLMTYRFQDQSIENYPPFTPENDTVYDFNLPRNEMKKYLADNGIDYIDLLPYYREYEISGGKAVHFGIDGHYNADGHEVAADAMCKELVKRYSGKA